MEEIASRIDHTLLKPTARSNDIEALCHEAVIWKFRAVCVNSANVAFCNDLRQEFKDTSEDWKPFSICSVIGFPLGAMHTQAKLEEAAWAIHEGANELDLVINLGWLIDGSRKSLKLLKEELDEFSFLAKRTSTITKLIIETGLLTDSQKVLACELAVEAGFDFVKTCTGFNGGNATVDDIRLMRQTVGDKAKIKASGGIKDLATARAMLEAGADVIGTSSGVKIVNEKSEDY